MSARRGSLAVAMVCLAGLWAHAAGATTFPVTSAADSGPNTLRTAITNATLHAGAAAIAVSSGGGGARGNTIVGNFIGVAPSGTAELPSADGVAIIGGAAGNTVGGTTAAARNVISGNTDAGVVLDGSGTSQNVVSGNYIGPGRTAAALGNGNG